MVGDRNRDEFWQLGRAELAAAIDNEVSGQSYSESSSASGLVSPAR
jgi:hypothetical protein